MPGLAEATRAARQADGPLLSSEADPVHPARIYGELMKVLDDDAVVIGDGGDFVSFAGKYLEPPGPADGLIRVRSAAWAPGSATPSRPGWPARPRRWSCCSATARPASR